MLNQKVLLSLLNKKQHQVDGASLFLLKTKKKKIKKLFFQCMMVFHSAEILKSVSNMRTKMKKTTRKCLGLCLTRLLFLNKTFQKLINYNYLQRKSEMTVIKFYQRTSKLNCISLIFVHNVLLTTLRFHHYVVSVLIRLVKKHYNNGLK